MSAVRLLMLLLVAVSCSPAVEVRPDPVSLPPSCVGDQHQNVSLCVDPSDALAVLGDTERPSLRELGCVPPRRGGVTIESSEAEGGGSLVVVTEIRSRGAPPAASSRPCDVYLEASAGGVDRVLLFEPGCLWVNPPGPGSSRAFPLGILDGCQAGERAGPALRESDGTYRLNGSSCAVVTSGPTPGSDAVAHVCWKHLEIDEADPDWEYRVVESSGWATAGWAASLRRVTLTSLLDRQAPNGGLMLSGDPQDGDRIPVAVGGTRSGRFGPFAGPGELWHSPNWHVFRYGFEGELGCSEEASPRCAWVDLTGETEIKYSLEHHRIATKLRMCWGADPAVC